MVNSKQKEHYLELRMMSFCNKCDEFTDLLENKDFRKNLPQLLKAYPEKKVKVNIDIKCKGCNNDMTVKNVIHNFE